MNPMNPMMQNSGGYIGAAPANLPQNTVQMQQAGHLRQLIFAMLQKSQQQMDGWRTQVPMADRMNIVQQIWEILRLMSPGGDLQHAARLASSIEIDALSKSPDKNTYMMQCRAKISDFHKQLQSRRQQAQFNAQARPGMPPNGFEPMSQIGQEPAFQSQLRYPMQPTQIPPTQGQSMRGNGTGLVNQQFPPGMVAARGVQGVAAAVNPNSRLSPQDLDIINAEDNPAIINRAKQFAANATPDQRQGIEQTLRKHFPLQLQNMQVHGEDPAEIYYRNNWAKQRLKMKQQELMHEQGVSAGQINPGIPNAPDGPNFGPGGQMGPNFMGNVGHFQGLQADGMRSQEKGHPVVPAGNGQGIDLERFRSAQMNKPGQERPNISFNQVQQQPGSTPRVTASNGTQQSQQGANGPASQAGMRNDPSVRNPQQTMVGQRPPGLAEMTHSGTPMSTLNQPVNNMAHGTPQPAFQNITQNRPGSRPPPSGQPQPQPGPMNQANSTSNAQTLNAMLAKMPAHLRSALSRLPPNRWKEFMAKQPQANVQSFPPAHSQPGHTPPVGGQPMMDGSGVSVPMQHTNSMGGSGHPDVQGNVLPGRQAVFAQQPQGPSQPQRRPVNDGRPFPPPNPGQQPSGGPGGIPPHLMATMNALSLPPSVLLSLANSHQVPPTLKTWGQLHQFQAANPHIKLPSEKLFQIQKQQYRQYLEVSNGSLQHPVRPLGDPNRGPGGHMMPGNPNGPPMHNQQSAPQQPFSQPSQGPGGMMEPVISRETIRKIRLTHPGVGNLPDDELVRRLREQHMRRMQQPPQQPPQAPQPSQTPQPPQQQPQQAQQPQQPPQQPPQQFTFISGSAAGRPPSQGARQPIQQPQSPPQPHVPAGTAARAAGQPGQPKAAFQPPRPAAGAGAGPPSQGAQTSSGTAPNQPANKGERKANVEGTSGPAAASAALQQQVGTGTTASVASMPPGNLQRLTEPEIAKLSPQDRKAYREKVQQHNQLVQKFQGLDREVQLTLKPSIAVHQDPKSLQQLGEMLASQKTKQMLSKVGPMIFQFWSASRSVEQVKQLLTGRKLLMRQYTEESIRSNTWIPVKTFSITFKEAERFMSMFMIFWNQFMKRNTKPSPANGPAAPATTQPSDNKASHALSADNLQKLDDMQTAHRNKRPSSEVPPAPTAAQPPFSLTEGTLRTQRVPRYAPTTSKPPMKQEDLKMPAAPKRQKRSHPETPLAPPPARTVPASSGQTSKVPKTEEHLYTCPMAGCEFAEKGFPTQSALDTHVGTAHGVLEENVANPVQNLMQSMATGLGIKLDENGKPIVPTAPKSVPMMKTASKRTATDSKPNTPRAAAMARAGSQASAHKEIPVSESNTLDAQLGFTGTVTMADFEHAFRDLSETTPGVSLTEHDPLSANNWMKTLRDQFAQSDAWAQYQAAAVSASSISPISPAQNSENGRASTSGSKLDSPFIKIDAGETELAEDWALPELNIDASVAIDQDEEMLDVGRASSAEHGAANGGMEVDVFDTMGDEFVWPDLPPYVGRVMSPAGDIEWEDVDWDKIERDEAEQKAKMEVERKVKAGRR